MNKADRILDKKKWVKEELEQWLFGGEKYAAPVLKAIDEFMETPV